jgi:site-specific DNA-adenine methylase
VYCDPPYAGVTKAYRNSAQFDSKAFWNACFEWSADNTVLVTEFNTPTYCNVLHDWGDTVVRHNNSKGSDGTSEVLVAVQGCLP